MKLLGGVMVDGELRRSFRFKPLTGALEVALATTPSGVSLPERVTAALSIALESLGGVPPDLDRIRGLSVGDRQFLMRELATHLDDGPMWLTASCSRCEEPFDLCIGLSDLPTKIAGAGYPRSELELGGRRLTVRVPTGEDQECLAGLNPDEAERTLLELLVEASGTEPWSLEGLEPDEVRRVEETVEAMTPEVGERAVTECPQCGSENEVGIDIYGALDHTPDEILADVYLLASHFHWSEADILGLPGARRRAYRELIDRGRGRYGAEPVLREAWA